MRILENFDLTEYNAYKIKAICKKAFFPEKEEDLVKIYNETSNINKIIIGNGNNILMSKKYYESYFIIFNGNFEKYKIKGNLIEAEAGSTLQILSDKALENNLKGLEMFYDIPSSVGGAIVMNAGADGEEIKDLLVKARYLDLSDMTIKEISKEEIGFEYRNSFFQKHTNNIVLKGWFLLEEGNREEIKNKMETIKQNRWKKQPREYPNCGSVFKRPPGRFVGPMLDELGLKGFAIGGAMISEKHSGFIVNKGNATGEDILNLISEVQKRVKAKFNVDLEVEQRII